MNKPIFFFMFFHIRTLQHFEESKLQLLRGKRIDIIERFSKALIVLKRKPGDQIQMLVYIADCTDFFHHLCHSFKPHGAFDLPDRIRIGRLYSDFQLDQTGTHAGNQFDLLFTQKVSRHLKMEIRNSIIMFLNICPDCHRMIMLAVKCTIDKLHLRYFFIQEKL